MERVWRNLPSELLEEVVTFLPLASLCRFRAVSKKWNRFISHPEFASRHARVSSPEEYVLISEREADHFFSGGGWEVLDVASKRSFNLSDDFLAEFVKQEGIGHCPRPRLWNYQRRTILTVDGGLLCLSYYISHGSRSFCELGTHEALLVCNPVLKTVKQIPHFAGWSESSQWIVMSTDRNSMEYEIFFINFAEDSLQPNAVSIYESKTASWRASAAVPGHLNALSGCREKCSASVVLKDEFYALFIRHDGLHAGLISYNKVTGAVSDLGIDVPCVGNGDYRVSLQLVVSDGRIFCVIMNMGPMKQVSSIEIVEFILARGDYIHISVLRSEILNWVLDNNVGIQAIFSECDAPAVATGLANSILLCSFAGRSLAYNLLDRTWHRFSDTGSNFVRGCKYSKHYLGLFGNSHFLSLCAP